MNTILLKNAEKNLKDIIAKTITDNEETVIVTDQGSVVMIDEKEWEHVKETLYLLNDKESLSSLLQSHALRDAGKEPEGKTIEEVFSAV
jgi:PHD/YefM family antitoxin component YafN of YafNO toxin-antitoxin module